MATAALTSEYCNLSVQDLRESPTNPRQRFEENSLKELCAYVVDNISSRTKVRRVPVADNLEPLERLHVRLQGTGTDSPIQSDSEAR